MNLSGVQSAKGTPVVQKTEAKQQNAKTQNAQNTTKKDVFTPSQTPPEDITYQPPKKLTPEQVDALKQQVQESMASLAEKMLGQQAEMCKKADGSFDYSALADAMGIGTTPEAAQEAISETGMWGVDAVATRLMDMAMKLSEGNPEMAQTMREAVQKGFAAVGDLEELPQVCQDTYKEVMKRFDYWEEHGSLDGYGVSAAPSEETTENAESAK